ETAVRGGVRVRSQHDVVGPHQIAIEPGVQDGAIRVVEVLDAALLGEALRELHQLLRALVGGERDRIDGVIDGEEEAILVVDTWFERLSALDALFLELEDRSSHMHVGAVALFEGPPPPYRDFLSLIEARLTHVPRYRQRVLFVPGNVGRPVWIDETQFDLEYHVRRTALPAPGGEEELKRQVGRLLSQALDREKPLWAMWLVEGLGDGRFAVVSKTHHCMLDGVAQMDLATVLMDPEPSSAPPPQPDPWNPRKAPQLAELLRTSLKEQLAH